MYPTIKIGALVLIFLAASVVSCSWSAPGAAAQTGGVTSGTAEIVFGIGLPRKPNKRILNFDLNWVNVTNLELHGSPEIQDYAEQLRKDINSGAVDGQVTVNLGLMGHPEEGPSLPAVAKLTFGTKPQRRPNRVGSPDSKPENLTGLKCSILFKGFINGSKRFNLEDLSLIPGSRVALRFRDKARTTPGKAAAASRENAGRSFSGQVTEQAIPGIRFGGLEINVDAWGKTPESLRNLRNLELSVISGSMQYDGVSGTVTGKYKVNIKRSGGL